VVQGPVELVDGVRAECVADLRPVERARDIIWTVNSVQTWMLLTRGRGWSQPEYANWVGQSLVDLLLDHG